MALHVKRDDLRHVPWFSLTEWQEVYKQIYSNDIVEQTKGYERLLVWKARLPKLPVGVECTLSIIQVCVRDREITPKINTGEMPSYYESDLCLMYSTTIMRFLNQITNIGQTKQSSLFQIAKQLKIPQWIVNIRHDAAHGHELPSISVLRIATNILFEWLHEEYWAAEAKAMEEEAAKQTDKDCEPEEVQILIDLIELWVSVGLYIHAGYRTIKDIPDVQLRETLNDLRVFKFNTSSNDNIELEGSRESLNNAKLHYDENYKLVTAQGVLLSEISTYLSKNKNLANKDEIILNVLLEDEAFLPNKEFLDLYINKKKKKYSDKNREDSLPLNFIQFWHDFIMLLYDKEILQKLILRLINLGNDETETDHKRHVASLWVKYILSSLQKMKLAQEIKQKIELSQENKKKKISLNVLFQKVQDKVDKNYPEFNDVKWFNALGKIPKALTDVNFVREIISNLNNKFSYHFVPILLELVTPNLDDNMKRNLLKFIKVYTAGESIDEETDAGDQVKTLKDFIVLLNMENYENIISNEKFREPDIEEERIEIGDQKIRNSSWILEPVETFDWGNCPFGILPWQLESMESVDTCSATNITCAIQSEESEILPGMVDNENLTMRSKINWDSVLGKRKRQKRRNCENHDNMIDKAIQIVKKSF